MAVLALMTGACLGELLALRWADLDLDAQVMYVRQTLLEHLGGGKREAWYSFKEPKSGKGRPVDLDAGTVSRLKAHRKAQAATRLRLGVAWTDLDLVITNAFGQPLRPSTASAHFRTVAQSLGFDRLRFHDSRHTHATILLKTGVPPHVVSAPRACVSRLHAAGLQLGATGAAARSRGGVRGRCRGRTIAHAKIRRESRARRRECTVGRQPVPVRRTQSQRVYGTQGTRMARVCPTQPIRRLS
jgi:Phage integrase family